MSIDQVRMCPHVVPAVFTLLLRSVQVWSDYSKYILCQNLAQNEASL